MGEIRPPEDGLRPSWDLITTFGPPPNKLAVRPPPHTQVVCPPPHTGCLSPPDTHMLFVPLNLCVVFVPGDKPLLVCVGGGQTHTYAVRPPQPVGGVCPRGQTYCVWGEDKHTYICRLSPSTCVLCLSPGTNRYSLTDSLTKRFIYICPRGTNKLFVPGDKQNVTH